MEKRKKKALDNIRIVMVEPQVPGNVGSAARAIKNMGISQLVLVKPWFQGHPQSRYMAHGSEDILENAVVTETLEEAVAGSVLVAGTTQRKRHNTPFMIPREAAPGILEAASGGPVSILFGREDKGLSNKELRVCNLLLTIPSSPKQPSLNLSQAIMVLSYELFMTVPRESERPLDLAQAEDLTYMYNHLQESLETLGLKQWNEGDNYMKSLRRVFSRTMLERRDVSVIHKFCGEIDKYAARLRSEYEKKGRS